MTLRQLDLGGRVKLGLGDQRGCWRRRARARRSSSGSRASYAAYASSAGTLQRLRASARRRPARRSSRAAPRRPLSADALDDRRNPLGQLVAGPRPRGAGGPRARSASAPSQVDPLDPHDVASFRRSARSSISRGAKLVGDAVCDQARGGGRDHLAYDQAVVFSVRPVSTRSTIASARPGDRRELDGALDLDHLGGAARVLEELLRRSAGTWSRSGARRGGEPARTGGRRRPARPEPSGSRRSSGPRAHRRPGPTAPSGRPCR